MRIAFITGNYPSPSRPAMGPFVQQFVWAMARQGHECTVINPISAFDRKYGPYPPKFAAEKTGEGNLVHVHRPMCLSFSSRDLGWTHTGRWSNATFIAAVLRAMEKLQNRPDIVYGHFLYPAGHAAVRAAQKMGIPSVVGVGEGEFWTLEPVGLPRAKREMRNASAFLAVSAHIAEELAAKLEIPPGKIRVFPNGVALDVFRPPHDQTAMCRKLEIPLHTFNVGYMGPFVKQKGYPQLREAVACLEDIRLVLLGRGQLPPRDAQIAFRGTVAHSEVPNYLGTCQIFVLPTRIEGSCNSVIEAMACGLPIVTSLGKYMDDIVDDEVSIRVDPADVCAIRGAILALKNDPGRRKRMSEACLRKARQFDINERARGVAAWMGGVVRGHCS
jgi:teichuronic acid biosynthesis glycosyltransferase TuaC